MYEQDVCMNGRERIWMNVDEYERACACIYGWTLTNMDGPKWVWMNIGGARLYPGICTHNRCLNYDGRLEGMYERGWIWMKLARSRLVWANLDATGWTWMNLNETGILWVTMANSNAHGWTWLYMDEHGWMDLWLGELLYLWMHVWVNGRTEK